MSNRIMCHEHETLLKLNFFQLMEYYRSLDSFLISICRVDAHDLKNRNVHARKPLKKCFTFEYEFSLKDSFFFWASLLNLLHFSLSRYTKTLSLKEQDRRFCHQCSLLVLPDEAKHHQGHKITYRLSLEQIRKPSHLLRPLENKKTNAVSVYV